ncbi:DNA repair protein rad50 [Entomophthora muscae]|uniref:DNA repair protein rad50 n=1 Tax=Entomophthora muscae TaxID=34485 RepID=A0ACC2S617_9FUNG|nr:DNA repair protein rad50 [Entomophthora muscae]
MASIEKLLLKGIRSFDPDENAVIHFYKPLTIIVGQNGSGKTTIIEALKYATTGDMPPNTKGGAFIHDPRVLGRNEVTSEVRLRFFNVNGLAMEAQRSAQVLQKKTTSTFKTLQSIIQSIDPETNEKTSITVRSCDLDEEMSRNLGVSKAILDNVIFCHQEESNWPLSDSSTLKKRFDEIFASTNYSKLCDELRKSAKAEAMVVKEHRMNLTIREKDREKAQKIRLQNGELQDKIQTSSAKTDAWTEQLEELSLAIETLSEGAEEQQQAITRLAVLERDVSAYSKECNEIRRTLDEIIAPNEPLEKLLADVEMQISNDKEKKNQIELQHQALDKELSKSQTQTYSLLSQQGKYKADSENYDRTLEERKKLISEIRPKLLQGSSPGSDLFFDDNEETVEEFFQLFESQIAHDQREAELAKEQSRSKQNELNAELQNLRIQELQCNVILKSSISKKEDCIRKLNDARERIKSIQTETIDIEALQRDVQEKETAVDLAKLKAEDGNIDRQIAQKNQELSEADDLLTKSYQAAPSPAQNHTLESRVTLTVKTADRKEKSNRLNKLIDANRKHFERHLNHTPLPQSIGYQVQSTIGVKKEAIKTKTHLVKDVNIKLASVEAKFAMLQSQVTKKQAQLIELQSHVQAACGSQDLPTAIRQAEGLLHTKESQLHQNKGMESIYSDLLDKSCHPRESLNDPKRMKYDIQQVVPESCPLCDATFQKQWDAKQFIKDLAEKHHSLQESSRELTLESQRVKATLAKLRNVSAEWDHLERIRKIELPGLEEEQRQYVARAVDLRRELGEHESELQQILLDVADLEKLIKPSLEISFLDVQLSQLDEELRLLPQDTACPVPDERSNQTSKLAARCKELRAELEALRSKKEAERDQIIELENAVRSAKDFLLKASSKDQDLLNLTTLISNLEGEIANAEKKAEMSSSRVEELVPQIASKQREIDLAISTGDELITKHQQSLHFLTQCKGRLNTMEQTIQQFDSNNTHMQLNQINITIQKHNSKISQIQGQLEELSQLKEALVARINTSTAQKENIQKNIKYLEITNKLEAAEQECTHLRQLYVNRDNTKHQAELVEKRERQNYLIAKRSGLLGEIRIMEAQIKRNQRELEISYKDIDELYRTNAHLVAISELKAEELTNYNVALEKAIMKYHSCKMAEINKIIQELWTSTYYGSDIDTIRIKSDAEKQAARSFNYRLVMVKGSVELDMRGRCSAGQKVLASIIVRLALAEAFGTNCGVLALDEPTTNLDCDNIRNLAQSLVSIIKSRSNQHNFQLVVITHDVEFTAALGRSDYTDHYWVVSKDNGKTSSIRRKDVKDIV